MNLIEFTGLPGSGKSTAAKIVKNELYKKGINIITESDLIGTSSVFFRSIILDSLMNTVIHPKLKRKFQLKFYKKTIRRKWCAAFEKKHVQLIDYINTCLKNSANSELRKRYCLNIFALYELGFENVKRGQILLLDEGLVHRIVNLFVSFENNSCEIQKVHRYLTSIPKVSLLIKIETNVNQACDQLLHRGFSGGRFDGKDKKQIIQFLKNANETINIGLKFLKKNNTNILTIDNFGNRHQFRGNLIAQIQRICLKVGGLYYQ